MRAIRDGRVCMIPGLLVLFRSMGRTHQYDRPMRPNPWRRFEHGIQGWLNHVRWVLGRERES